MTERPEDSPGPATASSARRSSTPSSSSGESEVWSFISTLVAGPAVWGLVGLGVDALVGSSGRLWTAVGVVVGFVTSLYIVYVRSIRSDGAAPSGHGTAGPPPSSTGDAR